MSKRAEKQLGIVELADFIEAKMQQGIQIKTVKQMRDDFEAGTGASLKAHQVREVMREELDLRYRKIVRLAPHANLPTHGAASSSGSRPPSPSSGSSTPGAAL